MPEKKEGDATTPWGRLYAVDDDQPSEAHLPPWERTKPSWQPKDRNEKDKNTALISFRVPTSDERRIQAMVQHRKIPALETRSDVCRWGLEMSFYWYADITNDAPLKAELELNAWESEQISHKNYRQRVTDVLNNLETELGNAKMNQRPIETTTLLDQLKRYGPNVAYDDLRQRAFDLWERYS